MSSRPDLTDTFFRWREGDADALRALVPLIYDETRALAGHYLQNEREGHTLQATALAHEAFLRLLKRDEITWQSRAHFMALVAQAMRRVLADHARRSLAQKRGARPVRLSLDDRDIADVRDVGADDLDAALEDLARLEPRQARVVEMRFYAGLSIDETAEVLGASPATVKRDWAVARAWLHRELSGGAA